MSVRIALLLLSCRVIRGEMVDQFTWMEGGQQAQVDIPGLGRVQGVIMHSHFTKRPIYSFLGLNYAKAPLGSLRFQPPEPFPGWTAGTYEATRLRQRCPQPDDPYYPNIPLENVQITEQIEDCLVVNIFTPQLNKTATALPVLFHIHGGSFYESSAQYFLPHFLLEKDIVLVTVQYRLGAIGFSSLQTKELAGNAGGLDMVLALEWVRNNIGAFGGDAARVTVQGESAGAASVTALLISPLVTKDLFSQVIAMSGSITAPWAISTDMVTPTLYLASSLNCSGVPDDMVKVAECLSSIPIEDLVGAHKALMRMGMTKSAFTVQTSGLKRFLVEHPKDSYGRGVFLKVPMVMGCTRDEGTFVAQGFYEQLKFDGVDAISRNYTELWLRLLGVSDETEGVIDVYYNKSFYGKSIKAAMPALVDLTGTSAFKAPSFRVAHTMSQHAPVYFYSFQFQGEASKLAASVPDWDDLYPFPTGVSHSDDISYLFPLLNYNYTQREMAMVRTMIDLYTNFIIHGNPIKEWKPLAQEFGPYLRIGEKQQLRHFHLDEYDVATREGFLTSSAFSFVFFPYALIFIAANLVF